MTKIGFLACETTLPGAGERREDAFEHDLMVKALEPAFEKVGLGFRVIDWEAPERDFHGLDAVMLGTAWNYQDKSDAFLTKLEMLSEAGIAVHNPPEVVRWNMTKTYLRDLADAGAHTIPTLWLDTVDTEQADAAFARFDCERLVVKRQIGAGALGQELLTRGDVSDDWHFDHAAMIQPFLPAIAEEGELSFIFIDGEFSHALRKSAAPGEYRIQSMYGGTESVHSPLAEERRAAEAIIASLPFDAPLYARIDMLRGKEGLLLMEAEMIEPYLYPVEGPQLGTRLAQAMRKRMTS
ncbi:MAG: hypothetical protein SXU28_06830 [Pseudomonadota bacterium]|nr:hypothetical protein [Pseudomonadota bacterium]